VSFDEALPRAGQLVVVDRSAVGGSPNADIDALARNVERRMRSAGFTLVERRAYVDELGEQWWTIVVGNRADRPRAAR